MIKVVHLITGLGIGGAENQLSQFVMHSSPLRFKHVVISIQDLGQQGPQLLQKGITVHTLNMRRNSISIAGFYRLYKILQKERPHILQTWLYHADLAGILMGKLLKIPKIIWNIRCSNMDLTQYSRLTTVVIKLCAFISFLPKAVIVNSKAGQKTHEALGYRVKNWINIPNGFKTDYFKPDQSARIRIRSSLKIQSKTLLIGMIARFDPMKNHFGFLAAAQKILNQVPNAQFMLVGTDLDTSNDILMQKIKSLGLASHVYLLGAQKDIPAILNALDLLVLPSAFGEGFPNVLGEAMACCVPCVASRVGDSELIIGDTGIVVKPSDPDALAKAMSEILKLDAGERQHLGKLARQRIIENYDFPYMIKQYETVYENLCAE